MTDEQIERLRPFFPKSQGKPRVDDRRVLSGIVFVNGLRESTFCGIMTDADREDRLQDRYAEDVGDFVKFALLRRLTTITLNSANFSISRLRGAFSGDFASWQEAVERGNTPLARQARAAIRALAFQGLREGPAAMAGFYLFIGPRQQDNLAGLNYIGIAEGRMRPIGRRIVDRLRDDSALDTSLDKLGPEAARRIVHDRLVCALPGSGQNYVDKHLKVAELCRRSSAVVLIGCDEPKQIIREAEKILIRGAVSAGAPVVNIQHRRFEGGASDRAYEVARAVIEQGVQHGLSPAGGEQWRSGLGRTAT